MSDNDLKILQLVKQLLQEGSNDPGLLNQLTQNLTNYGIQEADVSDVKGQQIGRLEDRIAYLEEQLHSTLMMTEMTIDKLVEEIENKSSIENLPIKPITTKLSQATPESLDDSQTITKTSEDLKKLSETQENPNPHKTSQIITETPQVFQDKMTMSTGINDYGYLGNALLTTEYKLRDSLPQSFFIQTSNDELKGSFVWVHEKTGLLYIIYVFCEGNDGKRVNDAVICNQLTNEVFLETRLLDACSIMQKIDERVAQLNYQQGGSRSKIQYAVCVFDRMNSKIDYVAAHTTLIMSHRDNFKKISGMPSMLGTMGINNEKCDKHTVDVQRGSQFYIIPKTENIEGKTIQKIKEVGRLDFNSQKKNLTSWLHKQLIDSELKEYFVSGFGF